MLSKCLIGVLETPPPLVAGAADSSSSSSSSASEDKKSSETGELWVNNKEYATTVLTSALDLLNCDDSDDEK
jgi:hypothetical protein